jgi:adenosine deaminase
MDPLIWKVASDKDEAVQAILTKLKRLTSGNYHTEAYILAAKTLGAKKLEQKFAAIDKLRELDGGLDSNLSKYQYRVYQDLMEVAKQLLSDEVYKLFYVCF